jgi:hypothetical protein
MSYHYNGTTPLTADPIKEIKKEKKINYTKILNMIKKKILKQIIGNDHIDKNIKNAITEHGITDELAVNAFKDNLQTIMGDDITDEVLANAMKDAADIIPKVIANIKNKTFFSKTSHPNQHNAVNYLETKLKTFPSADTNIPKSNGGKRRRKSKARKSKARKLKRRRTRRQENRH